MTSIEHLVENAITLQKEAKDKKIAYKTAWEQFIGDGANISMAAHSGLSLETAWHIGQYVVYDVLEDMLMGEDYDVGKKCNKV